MTTRKSAATKTARKSASKKAAQPQTDKPATEAPKPEAPKPEAPKVVVLPPSLANVKRTSVTMDPASLTDNPHVVEYLPLTQDDVTKVAANLEAEGQHYAILVAARRNKTDDSKVILDGHKRRAAALALGLKEVKVEILDVAADDPAAINFAFGINFARGEHTNSQKRAVGQKMLREHPEWSNTLIAANCGVSAETVRLWRGMLERKGEIEAVTERVDASGRTIDTSSIGKASASRSKPNFPAALLRMPEPDMLTPTEFTEDNVAALLSWQTILDDLIASFTPKK